jgi:hypothetical protein
MTVYHVKVTTPLQVTVTPPNDTYINWLNNTAPTGSINGVNEAPVNFTLANLSNPEPNMSAFIAKLNTIIANCKNSYNPVPVSFVPLASTSGTSHYNNIKSAIIECNDRVLAVGDTLNVYLSLNPLKTANVNNGFVPNSPNPNSTEYLVCVPIKII